MQRIGGLVATNCQGREHLTSFMYVLYSGRPVGDMSTFYRSFSLIRLAPAMTGNVLGGACIRVIYALRGKSGSAWDGNQGLAGTGTQESFTARGNLTILTLKQPHDETSPTLSV